jgi:hypothetical protein
MYSNVIRVTHLAVVASQQVLYIVSLSVLSVDSTNEHVVRDVVKVTTELEPRACHRDVISCALAL